MDADLHQMTFIVTFYSHFGAVRYQRLCAEAGISGRMMPVPRNLSSSCGTCVRCEDAYLPPDGVCREEIEQIAAWDGTQYTTVYHTDEGEDG